MLDPVAKQAAEDGGQLARLDVQQGGDKFAGNGVLHRLQKRLNARDGAAVVLPFRLQRDSKPCVGGLRYRLAIRANAPTPLTHSSIFSTHLRSMALELVKPPTYRLPQDHFTGNLAVEKIRFSSG